MRNCHALPFSFAPWERWTYLKKFIPAELLFIQLMNCSILGNGTVLDGIKGREYWHFYIIKLIVGYFFKKLIVFSVCFS